MSTTATRRPTRIDWEALVRGPLGLHPTQVRILEALSRNRAASPKQLTDEFGDKLGNVSYHVRILAGAGLLELVDTQPRRGAVEHFYRRTTG